MGIQKIVSEWANDWGRHEGIYGISIEGSKAGENDDLDAFRHAFCHAYLIAWGPFPNYNKDLSDLLGVIIEIFGRERTTSCSSQIDFHNNRIGQELAPTPQEMLQILYAGQDPTPVIARRIAEAVKRHDTINSFDDPRMPPRCHAQTKIPGGVYVWRTKGDKQVRWEHAMREGRIFRLETPPEDGNPGSAFNCRCVAEPVKEQK
jgi:hypothetical protein